MKMHKNSTHKPRARMRGDAMRTASLLISITVATIVGLPTIAGAAEPWGTWVRPSTGTQVNFYNCGGKLCAKITAVKDASRSSSVGTVIMTGAAKSGDSEWRGDLLNT